MTFHISRRMAFLLLPLIALSCGGGNDNQSSMTTRTPVTLTSASLGPLEETIDVNAVSSFLLKSAVKSNTTGYLQEVRVTIGQYVEQGQEIFLIKTKEARSLETATGVVDSLLRFRGVVSIKAPGSGYITQLNYRVGDYVQDGEALTTIGDKHSLVFLLDLPYELTPLVSLNRTVTLVLPDGRSFAGTVRRIASVG